MSDFEGVADTLYIPLSARIYVSKRFPNYFFDEKSLELESKIPNDTITKNSSDQEHLKLFETFGIMLSVVEKNAMKLWHAISGTAYIENYLEIKDVEILDAVRYHTTAKADMSLTAKILYLADFTSKDRNYPDVNIMRKLVDKSLDEAFIYALQYSIIDLTERSKAIHPDTVSAFNQVVLNLEET